MIQQLPFKERKLKCPKLKENINKSQNLHYFYYIMKNKKIFVSSEGICWKRQLDAAKICNYLEKNGYKLANKVQNADIIILITCAFLNGKAENSLNRVKEFQRYKAELIIAGCLPSVEEKELRKIFEGKIINTKNLDKDMERFFPSESDVKFSDFEDANILFESTNFCHETGDTSKNLSKHRLRDSFYKHLYGKDSVNYKFSKKQFHIRISWGCTGNCSYCTIKKSTGPFHSKPLEKCIKEFKKGLDAGYKNFILDATDVGAYGIDIDSSFTKLLDEMTKIEGDYYITIRELHPIWIIKYIDELEKILLSNKILILDIAVQSGDSRILKLMNRASNVEKMKEVLQRLKKTNLNFSMTCEFIIGFPTETEAEFKKSLDFIKEVMFDGGQIYSFSCRTGTEAEKIEPKVPEEEMLKRLKQAKIYLKKMGYKTIYVPEQRFLVFRKRN